MATNPMSLHVAVETNDFDVIHDLLNRGENPNQLDNLGTPVICVASTFEAIEMLLKHGADPNLRGRDGSAALDVAVLSEVPLSAVKLMLQHGANPNLVGPTRYTPFTYACKQCNTDLVKLMIANGADLNAPDERGLSPLQAARRCPDLQEFLRTAGAIA